MRAKSPYYILSLFYYILLHISCGTCEEFDPISNPLVNVINVEGSSNLNHEAKSSKQRSVIGIETSGSRNEFLEEKYWKVKLIVLLLTAY